MDMAVSYRKLRKCHGELSGVKIGLARFRVIWRKDLTGRSAAKVKACQVSSGYGIGVGESVT
jgi:hypothetical protein